MKIDGDYFRWWPCGMAREELDEVGSDVCDVSDGEKVRTVGDGVELEVDG